VRCLVLFRARTSSRSDSIRNAAQALPRVGLLSSSLRAALGRISPRAAVRALERLAQVAAVSLGGLRGAIVLSTSFAASLTVFRLVLPRAAKAATTLELGGLDLSPGAVIRNVADWGAENAAGDMWAWAGGWGWFKRLALGIDEEESGLWALIRYLLFGLKVSPSPRLTVTVAHGRDVSCAMSDSTLPSLIATVAHGPSTVPLRPTRASAPGRPTSAPETDGEVWRASAGWTDMPCVAVPALGSAGNLAGPWRGHERGPCGGWRARALRGYRRGRATRGAALLRADAELRRRGARPVPLAGQVDVGQAAATRHRRGGGHGALATCQAARVRHEAGAPPPRARPGPSAAPRIRAQVRGRLGRKRWASTPCSSLTSIRSSTRLPGAARGAQCWASTAPGAPEHDGPTGAT
jgi:hypothetical protein